MLILNIIYFIFLCFIVGVGLFLVFIIFNIWTKSYKPQNTNYIIIPLLILLIITTSLSVISFLDAIRPLRELDFSLVPTTIPDSKF